MADYSIGGRVHERKGQYIESTLAPTAGQAVEIRVDEALLHDKVAFWTLVERMMQQMREQGQPRF